MALSTPIKTSTRGIYSGCGNRFIVTDEADLAAQTTLLCQLNGTDGLILIEKSDRADFKMRLFNADGTEAEMCGNGLRCAVRFMQGKSHYLVETAYALCPVSVEGELISMTVPLPGKIEKIQIDDLEGFFLNTGVPHAVFFVENLKDPSWMERAPFIRRHKRFAPEGTNVNFVKLGEVLHMRTYERGVEGETGACGTGTVAVAVAARFFHGINLPVKIIPSSGEALFVEIQKENVILTGPAKLVSADVCTRNN